MLVIRDPIQYYFSLGGKLRTEPIPGDRVFDSLDDWYAYPYKYEIMNQALEFNQWLHQKTKPRWYSIYHQPMIGLHQNLNCTAIYDNMLITIEDFIEQFGEGVKGNPQNGNIPKSLVQTELGYTIYKELIEAMNTFSDNVFCHGCIRYDSFIVRDHKLVGMRNWKYVGYYPPEFDVIVQRYLEYI